jgi:hypothetical protein
VRAQGRVEVVGGPTQYLALVGGDQPLTSWIVD